MDPSFLLIVGLVLAFPAMAVIALVKAGKARKLLDEASGRHDREIVLLRADVANLRRELSRLSDHIDKHKEPQAETRQAEHGPDYGSVAVPSQPAVKEASPIIPQRPVAAPVKPPIPVQPVPATVVPPAIPQVQRPHEPIGVSSAAEINKTPEVPSSAPVPPKPAPAMPPKSEQPLRPAAFAASGTSAPRPSTVPSLAPVKHRKSLADRLRSTLPLEEVLGMNVFARIGIVLLVLGFALLGRMALIAMGPGERVALIYATAAAMLGGGIRLETRDRYRLIGRAGIGGGWALLFFTTYAMHHVTAMAILSSNTADCVLMLLVAIGMVVHTLRYESQVVTGLAFLLAFSTVALSQDSVYALSAGVILAVGIVTLALRMGWYELETFGILASYGNHFYWLYKLYPEGFAGHAFPQFWPSTLILILYWFIFRVSYVSRRIRSPRDETVSSLAALLNTVALLGVMKFQSTRSELAFYALLGLGAIEFSFGQLPSTRRRRNAFKLLTLVGTVLMFASVPFKFSGNSIALFWMIAAELLLVAGIVQSEVVFRRLGLIAGSLTGLLIVYEAWHIIELRQHSEALLIKDGTLLLTASLVFCINAYFVRPKWRQFFEEIDGSIIIGQGYLGAITAFFGMWAVLSGDWTVVGWVGLFLLAAAGKRFLDDNHLLLQASAFGAAVLIRCGAINCHFDTLYPHHIAARLITLPLVAVAFYVAAWILSGVEDVGRYLRLAALWAGTLALAALVWLEVSQSWVAPVWVALAVALALGGRRLQLPHLSYQQHVLGVAAIAQLVDVNLDISPAIDRYIPLIGCAASFYAISRFCTQKDASYSRFAAWAHTWAASGLLAALAWHESPQPWLAVVWACFALILAIVDRIFAVEELPYQAHILALLAVLRAATLNLYLRDNWHGIDLRLITTSIVITALYLLARWVRLPESARTSEARHAYTWVASVLAAWMMWAEFRPVAVAPAWAVFGLLLLEIGLWKQQKQLRWQAFIALAAAFIRIFFVNLTAAAAPGENLSPRLYTIVPMVLIYFYVWVRLQNQDAEREPSLWSTVDLIAYFGSGCVTALLYFETSPEWIVVAWALFCFALVLSALLVDKKIFLQQGVLLVVGIVGRSLAHNIFGGSYFLAEGWRGRFYILSIVSAVLLSILPVAFRLRSRISNWSLTVLDRYLAIQYPEQVFFFAPSLLITLMIAVKMNPGMVTLSWGIEGVAMILLGLLVSQRSYRLTGLLLLLLCVAKIIVRDAWLLGERDRYTTFIALGAALTAVSMLYGKYRETVRRLL